MSDVTELQPAQALAWINENVGRGKQRIEDARKSLDALIEESHNPPPSKDGTDYKVAIAIARSVLDDEVSEHFKWLGKQQLFDKSVDQTKRDSSESITRAEGARLMGMFIVYMRTATEAFLTRIIPEIRESKSNEDAYALCERAFGECFGNSVKGATDNAHLPAWSRDALIGAL